MRDDSPNIASEVASTVVPYRNPCALISYYVGLFSLIPCVGLILAPIAVILGIIGLIHRSKNPQAHGSAHAIVGLATAAVSILYHVGGIVYLSMDT